MVRHTVGMMDAVETLAAIHRETGCRYFKLKLSGDPAADRARLVAIAAALEGIDYRVTLDANEQYATHESLAALCDALTRDPELAELAAAASLYRAALAARAHFRGAARRTREAICLHRRRGGKRLRHLSEGAGARLSRHFVEGLQGHLQVAAERRARGEMDRRGPRAFLAAEDLTCQAGLAVQQDTALARLSRHRACRAQRPSLCRRLRRDAAGEIQAFQRAHPDLYEERDGSAASCAS